jgi:hypothetical protein
MEDYKLPRSNENGKETGATNQREYQCTLYRDRIYPTLPTPHLAFSEAEMPTPGDLPGRPNLESFSG